MARLHMVDVNMGQMLALRGGYMLNRKKPNSGLDHETIVMQGSLLKFGELSYDRRVCFHISRPPPHDAALP